MKIAFVKDALSTGRGADHAVAALMNSLSSRGHDVTLVTLQDENVPFSVALDPSVRIMRVAPDGVSAAADQCDVIVSAGTNEILLLANVRRPVVQQFHTHPASPFKWRHPLRNRAICRALGRAVAVQVLLPGHVSALPSGLRSRAVVIGNAPAVMPSGDNAPEYGNVIICPAALNRSKNQELLIRAFALLSDEFPAWTLELYGTGPVAEERRLTALVASLSQCNAALGERIEFMGYRDLRDAYVRCAFLAFPSRVEGFGLAIVEAAAFGKPTVGLADSPGVNELVRDGESGILTGPSVRAFADGMRRLMADGNLLRRLGHRAEETCRSRYAQDRITDSWEQLVNRVACGTGGCFNGTEIH